MRISIPIGRTYRCLSSLAFTFGSCGKYDARFLGLHIRGDVLQVLSELCWRAKEAKGASPQPIAYCKECHLFIASSPSECNA